MLRVSVGIGAAAVVVGGTVWYTMHDRVRNVAQPYLNNLYFHPIKTWKAVQVAQMAANKYGHVEVVAKVLYGLDHGSNSRQPGLLTALPFKSSYMEYLCYQELVVMGRAHVVDSSEENIIVGLPEELDPKEAQKVVEEIEKGNYVMCDLRKTTAKINSKGNQVINQTLDSQSIIYVNPDSDNCTPCRVLADLAKQAAFNKLNGDKLPAGE